MTINRKDLDRQINVFLALRGHDHQMVDWWQVMREMMEEINYWRMVAKHPGAVDRPRGGQKTAEMDRVRYQHMIGYLTGKHSINQAEAAEIISDTQHVCDWSKAKAKNHLRISLWLEKKS